MNKLFQLLIALVVIGAACVAIYTQIARVYDVQHVAPTAASVINRPPGPEADPYLRHLPNGYDYENVLPPNELPLQ